MTLKNKTIRNGKIVDLELKTSMEKIIEKEISDEEKSKEVKVMYSEKYKELEQRLRSVFKESVNYFEQYIFPEYFDIIKAKVLFAGDIRCWLQKNGDDTQFAEVFPLISSIHDSFHSYTYDMFNRPKAIPRNAEDIQVTVMAQDFIDRAENTSNSRDYEQDIILEASLLGTSFGQFGVSVNDTEVSYIKDGLEKVDEISDVAMKTEHVSVFDMFYDPQAVDFYDTDKYRRKIYNFDRLKSSYEYLFSIDEDLESLILNNPYYITDKDYSKIYQIKNYEGLYLQKATNHFNTKKSYDGFMFDEMFQISKKQQWCEVWEYRTDKNLVVMVNGYICYDGPNPYPINKSPFGVVVYQPIPKSIRGRGIGHLLSSHQKQANTHWNAIQNGVYRNAYPMYAIDKGLKDPVTNKAMLTMKHKPGKTFITESIGIQNGGIRPLTFDNINYIQLAQSALDTIKGQAYEIVGINSLLQGGGTKVERVPGAVRAQQQTLKGRLTPMMNSLQRFNRLKYQTWLAIGGSVLDDTFTARIFDKEGNIKFSEITPESLINRFDIVIETDSQREASKGERYQAMLQLVQSVAPFMKEERIVNGQMLQVPHLDLGGVIKEMAETLHYDGIKVMSEEDKQEWIARVMAQAQSPEQQMPQAPQEQVPNRKELYQQKNTTEM